MASPGPKRMIADADTAEVDTSLIPHPLVLWVAIVNCSAGKQKSAKRNTH